MKLATIPVSSRQVLYLAAVLLLPIGLALAAVTYGPAGSGQPTGSRSTAALVLGLLLLMMLVILWAVTKRRAVELTDDALVVRHSLYTLVVAREAVTDAAAQQLAGREELGLALRTNGIAAFGYLSGWFRAKRNLSTFCAVSTGPLQLITFEGQLKCRQLALSASEALAADIVRWGRREA